MRRKSKCPTETRERGKECCHVCLVRGGLVPFWFSPHPHHQLSGAALAGKNSSRIKRLLGTEVLSELFFGSNPTQTQRIQSCCLFSCQTPRNLVKERRSQSLNRSYRSKESLDNRLGNKDEQDNSHIFQPPDLIIIYNVGRLRQASVPLVHVNTAERHKEE